MTTTAPTRLRELQAEYQAKVNRALEIRKPYEGKSAAMTAEESLEFDNLMTEADRLMEEVEREQSAQKHTSFMNDPAEPMTHPAANPQAQGDGDPAGNTAPKDSLARQGFKSWLKYGDQALSQDSVKGIPELKALQVDVDTLGGYLSAPQEFVRQLIQDIDDDVFIRQLATKFTLTMGVSLGAPSLETDLADAEWTSELGTGSQDDALRFGKRELFPHPLAKRVLISNTMLRAPGLDAEQIVRQRLAYRHGTAQENAFLTGTGSGQPLGVFTASSDGISTSRDVSTGNTTTAMTADGLIEAKYNQKAAYWPRSRWMFHRDGIKQIRQLKDGDGQYLWTPGLSGQPGSILDIPFVVSEFCPNTFTTGLYVGILGDFSNYWIADSLFFQVQRLVELYAATNQTAFISRLECDGMPVKEEAFTRVKLA